MKLYRINKNPNRYCGPSVISAIAGIGTNEAAAYIRHANQEKLRVVGTSHDEMKAALALLGYSATEHSFAAGLTVGNLMRSGAATKDVYLVATSRHWLLVQGVYAICGKTIDFVFLKDHPNASSRISKVFKLARVRAVDVSRIALSPKKRGGRYAMNKAKNLASLHRIEIEQIDQESMIAIDPPPGIFNSERKDPYEDNHYCETWADALERVQKYAALIGS